MKKNKGKAPMRRTIYDGQLIPACGHTFNAAPMQQPGELSPPWECSHCERHQLLKLDIPNITRTLATTQDPATKAAWKEFEQEVLERLGVCNIRARQQLKEHIEAIKMVAWKLEDVQDGPPKRFYAAPNKVHPYNSDAESSVDAQVRMGDRTNKKWHSDPPPALVREACRLGMENSLPLHLRPRVEPSIEEKGNELEQLLIFVGLPLLTLVFLFVFTLDIPDAQLRRAIAMSFGQDELEQDEPMGDTSYVDQPDLDMMDDDESMRLAIALSLAPQRADADAQTQKDNDPVITLSSQPTEVDAQIQRDYDIAMSLAAEDDLPDDMDLD